MKEDGYSWSLKKKCHGSKLQSPYWCCRKSQFMLKLFLWLTFYGFCYIVGVLLFSCSVMSDSLWPCGLQHPGFPILHYLWEFAQTRVHWVNNAIQPSHPVTPLSFCPQSFPTSGSFPMNQLFTSGSRSIGTSASASDLPMNIQCCFPLGLTGYSLPPIVHQVAAENVRSPYAPSKTV